MRASLAVAGAAVFVLAQPAGAADSRWSAELFVGSAYNFNTRLKISQDGYPDLAFTADYETRPFDTPPYYALRLSRWTGDTALGVWFLHHKLFLSNPPSEVGHFSITHGFNLLALDRAAKRGSLIYHVGVGAVITHTEAEVRGIRYGGSYELAGAAVHAGLGWRHHLARSWYLGVEGLGVLAYAKTNPEGTPSLVARVPNASIHALLGVGYDF